MSNVWQNYYFDHEFETQLLSTGDVHRAVALVVDGIAAWNEHDGSTFSYSYGWPDVEVCIGEPTGPARFEGEFIRRDFQYGKVEIEWKAGDYPDPFNYRIWALGQLVEELSIPFHHP
jgi:hypothetical protein